MKNNKKGFTLTEILIVIAIIGVILCLAIPSIVAIRKRINERLLENKKKIILTAAESYGKDVNIETDTIIYVFTLIDKYVDAEIKQNDSNCSGDNTSKGCVINPVDNTSLNNSRILLKKNGNKIKAVWEGEISSTIPTNVVATVKNMLGCSNVTESSPCLYTGENPNNYLYYSGVMWRVMGVYLIDGVETVKMISDDNVVWDYSA